MVYTSTLQIQGALLSGENPLPVFRARQPDGTPSHDGTLGPAELEGLGLSTGFRVLPYRMQDRYSRDRRPMNLKTVVLENAHLRAVLLPQYGGRLYSLFDKNRNREILYKNPVMQPANLAIRNAWFSGGIEWNCGQVGHAYTTCSDMFCAKMDGPAGEYVRIYEFERAKGLYFSVDFHLPEDSRVLYAHMRIVNPGDQDRPMYWWTNIAVDETDRCRVFAGTGDVIYLSPGKGFGWGTMPVLPSVPGRDVSYPMHFPFANEYFFQYSKTEQNPWEAVAYEDGSMFAERSTALLRYRKMFCWGSSRGGRHWEDYLAEPGKGRYIEVQGGLAPTQNHSVMMKSGEEWSFTQAFGLAEAGHKAFSSDWYEACGEAGAIIEASIPSYKLNRMHELFERCERDMPLHMLHIGSGWGALEQKLKPLAPEGMVFSDAALTDEQTPWLTFVQGGSLPETASGDTPAAWMTGEPWLALMRGYLAGCEDAGWHTLLHYGVMLYENFREDEAVAALNESVLKCPSPWAYRCLSVIHREKEPDKAFEYMQKAVSIALPDVAFAEEYLSLLINHEKYNEAWLFFEGLGDIYKRSERVMIASATAALHTGRYDYVRGIFKHDFAVIREGEVSLESLWYELHAAEEYNVIKPDADMLRALKRKHPSPKNITFSMSKDEE